LNLFERGEHIRGGAAYARQYIVFEISTAWRRLAGGAEWFVAVPPDPFHGVSFPARTLHIQAEFHAANKKGSTANLRRWSPSSSIRT
jgi:hypothetical protein